MRKIFIKLPDKKVNKFRLQRVGWEGQRFGTAAGLLNALNRRFPRHDMQEKTAICIREVLPHRKGYKGTVTNESAVETDRDYLLWVTACFLEEFLTKGSFRKFERLTGY